VRPAFSLLASALVLAGCGAGKQRGGDAASTSQASNTKAPPIVLESAAGRQEAVPGSSCVSSGDGVIGCSDAGRLSPESLSIVRPGEEVRIFVEDADVVRSDGCMEDEHEGECIGTAAVRELGCKERAVAKILLAPGPVTTWSVDLAPGAYEIDVFAYFVAADGRGGDVSGWLGLLVDETAALEVVAAPKHDCLAE
jgi:hypothetical protein